MVLHTSLNGRFHLFSESFSLSQGHMGVKISKGYFTISPLYNQTGFSKDYR